MCKMLSLSIQISASKSIDISCRVALNVEQKNVCKLKKKLKQM